MQSVDIDTIKEMYNPEGLDIIHPAESPTLCKIIDAEGNQVDPNLYTSRQRAEFVLYKMLLPEQKEEVE